MLDFFIIFFVIFDGFGDDKICIDILVIFFLFVRLEELGLIIGWVCFRVAVGIIVFNFFWVGIKL